MEAAWLAALVGLPVWFNPYSARSFEPDKIIYLRCLALVVLAAWLVRGLEQVVSNRASVLSFFKAMVKTPLAMPVAALSLAFVAATCLSVNREASLWGSDFLQGTVTFFSYLVLFGTVAACLRRPEQIERLVTTAVVASLPVALYAIMQRMGYDPISFSDSTVRVISMSGNPNYLAAYLIMIIPLGVGRMIRLARTPSHAPEQRLKGAALGFYGLVAAIQVLALIFTEGRGAVVGLLVGLALLFILLAIRWNRRRWLMAPFLAGGFILIFLVLLNMPQGPLKHLRTLPILARFSEMLSPKEGTVSYRTEIWKEAPKLMRSSSPLPFPDGGADGYHSLRPWLGYGPETLGPVLAHQYSIRTTNPLLEDRFHNLILDLWVSVGAVGVVSFLAVFVLLFFHAYRGLGLIQCRRECVLFWAVVIVLAGGGAGALAAWHGTGFAGLGLQLGLVAGLAAYPVAARVVAAGSSQPALLSEPKTILLAALLAALAAHFIETGFGFALGTTTTLFWIYAGMILVLVHFTAPATVVAAAASSPVETGRPAQGKPARDQAKRKVENQPASKTIHWANHQAALLSAIITSFIVLAMIFVFVHAYASRPLSASDILTRSLLQLNRATGASLVMLLVFLGVWLGSTFALTGAESLLGGGKRWVGQFWFSLLLSGGAVGIYGVAKAWQLSAIGPLPGLSTSARTLLRQSAGYETLYLVFMAVNLGLVLLGAVVCAWGAPQAQGNLSKRGVVVGLAGLLAALGAAFFINLKPACADIAFKWAEAVHARKVWPAATEVYERAIRMNPGVFQYRSQLASCLRDQAEASGDEADFNRMMAQAEQIHLEAPKLFRFSRSAYRLGDLYVLWAAREADPARKLELARKASQAFDRALLFEPYNPLIWNQSALVDLMLLHQEETGVKKNQRAIELEPRMERARGVFGDFYANKSAAAQTKEDQQRYARQALEHYSMAASNAIELGNSPFAYFVTQGNLCLGLNDTNQAVAAFLAATQTAPPGDVWRTEEMLARLYYDLSNKPAALEHVQAALEKAPADRQAALLQLKDRARKLP